MIKPNNLSHEIMMTIYPTIGKLAVNWSLMDFSLDALIAVLHHDFDGMKKVEEEVPREFTRKPRYISRYLRSPHVKVAPLKPALKKIVDKVGYVKQFRHDVIHGYLSHYDPKSHNLTFVCLDRTKNKRHHQIKERKMTQKKLLGLADDAQTLATELNRITVRLLREAHGEEELKDLLSDFRG